MSLDERKSFYSITFLLYTWHVQCKDKWVYRGCWIWNLKSKSYFVVFKSFTFSSSKMDHSFMWKYIIEISIFCKRNRKYISNRYLYKSLYLMNVTNDKVFYLLLRPTFILKPSILTDTWNIIKMEWRKDAWMNKMCRLKIGSCNDFKEKNCNILFLLIYW